MKISWSVYYAWIHKDYGRVVDYYKGIETPATKKMERGLVIHEEISSKKMLLVNPLKIAEEVIFETRGDELSNSVNFFNEVFVVNSEKYGDVNISASCILDVRYRKVNNIWGVGDWKASSLPASRQNKDQLFWYAFIADRATGVVHNEGFIGVVDRNNKTKEQEIYDNGDIYCRNYSKFKIREIEKDVVSDSMFDTALAILDYLKGIDEELFESALYNV